ncbi:hypothetical protein Q7C36_001613 [Tachysurus vachellii]|uniref:non-specific serine/threonine protein kinase n=1 Tax=Tachysurus vachellii TaxID=175792 RepID=A0AA88NW99_TACVA|nr:hypothetical protein Q7C36_001613 [Tachysurus vachellii]
MADILNLTDEQLPAVNPWFNIGNKLWDEPEPLENNHEVHFPLMSKNMQKENLLQFIQWQIQNSHKCNQVEEYIFWQIMELFCHQNGKVMMCEVASLLLKVYDLLQKKPVEVRNVQTLKEWCLPLARLLCSAAPDDKQREAVIKMGDDLASRKLTFAAHICYVVAKVELGSRGQFELIGCDRLPYGMLALFEPFLRTETYEYVLWLTSGKAQPSFQIFKYLLASRMAYLYAPERAIKYCEVIARAVVTFPDRTTRSFTEQLVLLSCKLQNEDAEEPEWLLELKQLHRTKLASANVSDDPEQHMTSTSQTFRASEIQQSEGCLLNENISELQCPDSEHYADLEALLSLRYQLGELLRSGHFGFVFKAVRIADKKKVAVKVVTKYIPLTTTKMPGVSEELPTEVALMMMASKPPVCSNIVELLEWFDMGSEFVMILERPSPCMDLVEFQKLQKGFLSESQARDIMVQVIRAARHCRDRGVFHCDIRAENLIINPDTLEVKLIDFGCGELLKDTTYKYYYGTMYFAPPEWLYGDKYMAVPATIWGLGVLLFHLLTGEFPFEGLLSLNYGYLKVPPDLSPECFHLLMWCLDVNPETRPSFEHLLRHEWFTGTVQDKVQVRQ